MSQGHVYHLQVRPEVPDSLRRLEEIAGDLWFAWNAKARSLFVQMDQGLWFMTGHNPRLFLHRVSQSRLNEVAADRAFLSQYHSVLADYDSYMAEAGQWYHEHDQRTEDFHVAYFSAEFGLHESLPIYSGGLGMLAGDHCKSASDLGLPFTAVGMLYRNGYFTQTIDTHGNQVATYFQNRFEELCVEPAVNSRGEEVHVHVALPGRDLKLKVWVANAGHIRMLLLDSELAANTPEDRTITHQLYGGGIENRIRQEIVLGVGGVRALRAMEITPSVWHANEGHAAFVVIERMSEFVQQQGLSFDEALEATAASTVFTTHTPVPAGHDVFPLDMFDHYMGHYAQALGVPMARLHELGYGDFGHGAGGFNQTALATHGSAFLNGVAKLHGEVSAQMFHSMWPDIEPEENPVSSVTNGVHVATWLSQEWINTFDLHLGGGWRGKLRHRDFWERIHTIPDHLFWSIHQTNKQRMLQYVHESLMQQAERNGESAQLVREMTRFFDVRTLVIGFARRFATYKRATLLFQDEARLKELLDSIGHPVVFLFAGKAHPADKPGQELIRRIHEIARKPDFKGRILMLEGYDMTLARFLISGVDVWLNNPRRPMEASGTSGMKAAMNGAPNLSILDGWWPEGYKGDNGWVIGGERDVGDDQLRDIEDSESLYHVLKNDVAPLYYTNSERGYSEGWVYVAKRAMIESIPMFNTDRMVSEYTERFYIPASAHGKAMLDDQCQRAKALAAWKKTVRSGWGKLSLAEVKESDYAYSTRQFGEPVSFQVKVNLGGLSADDVRVEAVLMRPSRKVLGDYVKSETVALEHQGDGLFAVQKDLQDTGNYAYRIRMYPSHPDLSHPLAMGMMKYL